MKTEMKLVGAAFGALIGLSITLLVMSFTGCSSSPETNAGYCANAQKVITAYEASLAVRVPTPDETKVYTAAKAIRVLYCGAPGSVAPVANAKGSDIGQIPLPRQPKRIVIETDGKRANYYLKVPFSILSGGEIFKRDMAPTITIGPLYSRTGFPYDQYLWMPDQAWLQGLTKTPTMLPIR